MIGILYLILCFSLGWVICSYGYPDLVQITKSSYNKHKICFSPYLMLFPVWFIIGTLAMTWATYITAYIFNRMEEPLLYANGVIIPLTTIIIIVSLIAGNKKGEVSRESTSTNKIKKLSNDMSLICDDEKVRNIELVLLLGITALAFILMWRTFFIKDGDLYVGVSVFSDFSPHIGMIRSFSYGNNFPTSYSHYAGSDIKYHFMFQFLVGNLEYLGLRIDYAFNIPSILSFISAFLLLYLLALKITGKIGVGILACLFFAFRSSKALFTFLSQVPKGTGVIQALNENTAFIGETPHEDWGLWNLNVYANQRHLAFGLGLIFFIIILFLGRAYGMNETIKNLAAWLKDGKEKTKINFGTLIEYIFFSKEGWEVDNLRYSVVSGILLGSLSFFHGSAVIGCLLVLFIVAIIAKHRLEFAILAIITIVIALLQTSFFIDGSAVGFEYLFGFIAENKTIFGVASYLERLLGILPLVLLVGFCLQGFVDRHIMLAFTLPLIFAFTVSLTVDVTVNHKYIMLSCILLGIYAADLVIKILERGEWVVRLAGFALIIALTATGIYDFMTVVKKNTPENSIVLDLEDPLTKWIDENSVSKDIFLTSNYSINQVVLGGAMLYQGWQYFGWSAGYDTMYRDSMVKQMYEASSPSELDRLVKKNNIRFIIVDHDNRYSLDYSLNEENIRNTYISVYTQGEGDWKISIYDTRLLINDYISNNVLIVN